MALQHRDRVCALHRNGRRVRRIGRDRELDDPLEVAQRTLGIADYRHALAFGRATLRLLALATTKSWTPAAG